MASKQSQAVRDHWRRMTEAARTNPDQTPEEVRERVEKTWGGLTAEPVSSTISRSGSPACPPLSALPKGSPEDSVILSVHGGGGVSGSIYTHRKLFGRVAGAPGPSALLTEYRQAPYPAPLEDTTSAYRWLLDRGVDARHIAITRRFAWRWAVHLDDGARPRAGPARRGRVDADVTVGGPDGQ